MTYKFPTISNKQTREVVQKHSILITLAGSRSYGTHHDNSDYDYRGVLVLPQESYLSFQKPIEQAAWKEKELDEEGTIYEIRKFFGLALQCNPNIIECLFADSEHVVYMNEAGQKLRDNREIFLSQITHKSFLGYARSQLKRIKTHKAWIDSPPQKLPERSDFGLPEVRPVSYEQMNAARAYIMKHTEAMVPWLLEADNLHKESFWEGVIWLVSNLLQEQGKSFDKQFDNWLEIEDFFQDIVAGTLGFNDGFIELSKKEKAYLQAVQHWKQYESWKANRNPARADLESKYGFDAKHASHLVRLMRMGEEVLLKGEVNVFRKEDREELVAIRNGQWSFEQLIEWADEKTSHLNEIVRSGKSILPEKPDYNKAEDLLINLIVSN